LSRWNSGWNDSTAATANALWPYERTHCVFGVARSPKLVNRNGARPRGAVVKVAVNGSAPSLSAVTV
jgi:hypothetical protein